MKGYVDGIFDWQELGERANGYNYIVKVLGVQLCTYLCLPLRSESTRGSALFPMLVE
jgi:hypothetical protein